ncbi:hypothetical protein BX600DRAFT_271926 [Xylariales sp. PMI_506]|nr:hypothetical protein BX600DRAFT_271926 [Xylariales sp. PMI_506]
MGYDACILHHGIGVHGSPNESASHPASAYALRKLCAVDRRVDRLSPIVNVAYSTESFGNRRWVVLRLLCFASMAFIGSRVEGHSASSVIGQTRYLAGACIVHTTLPAYMPVLRLYFE